MIEKKSCKLIENKVVNYDEAVGGNRFQQKKNQELHQIRYQTGLESGIPDETSVNLA